MKRRRIRLYDPLGPKKIQKVVLTPTELRVDDEVISMERVTKITLKPITKVLRVAELVLGLTVFVAYFIKAVLPFIVFLQVEIMIAADPNLEAKRAELNKTIANIFHVSLPANIDASFKNLLIWILVINLLATPIVALIFKRHLLINLSDGTSKEFFYRLAMYLPQSRFLSASRKIIKKRIMAEKKAAKKAPQT